MFELLFSFSQAQVLRFLSDHTGQSFYEREIVPHVNASRSAVNLATRSLSDASLLVRERRGRMNFYSANDRHPFVRQFKVLSTVARLEPLLQALRPLARQVILFGSCAHGTDTADSDVDLFILAADRRRTITALSQFSIGRRIQPMVVDNQELAALKEKETPFYAQVQKGIVLWEATDELGA
jgi:predicted nucleotidyltransferase